MMRGIIVQWLRFGLRPQNQLTSSAMSEHVLRGVGVGEVEARGPAARA